MGKKFFIQKCRAGCAESFYDLTFASTKEIMKKIDVFLKNSKIALFTKTAIWNENSCPWMTMN